MDFTTYNEDCGKNELGNQLEKGITQMSALQSLLTGEELSADELPFVKEFECVKEFLELPLNDKKENDLKKLFATFIVIAEEKGMLPFKIEKSPVAVASVVDEALTRLKVGYQTAIGELDAIEAVDALIDRAAVRTIAVVDKAIEQRMPIVLDKVCTQLVKIYPPISVVVPVIKQVERYIAVGTKVVARKGVWVIANTAKAVVRKVAERATKVTSKIMNFLKA